MQLDKLGDKLAVLLVESGSGADLRIDLKTVALP